MKIFRPNAKSGVRSRESERTSPGRSTEIWVWSDEGAVEKALREDSAETLTDLQEQILYSGEAFARFAREIPRGPATNRLNGQLIKTTTSVGDACVGAKDGISRKHFEKRVATRRRQSEEAMFFLPNLAATEESLAAEARRLWFEASEINWIFVSIRGTTVSGPLFLSVIRVSKHDLLSDLELRTQELFPR